MKNDLTRRQFLTRTGAAALSGTAAPILRAADAAAWLRASRSQNDKLVMGLIGCGGMGTANTQHLMGFPDVEFAAVCDVDESHIGGISGDIEKRYGRKPAAYKDYRQLLDRKDIDAVVIATPDHWHALNLIHACEAGKDVYQEKPLSHDIVEALSMAGAVTHHNRVVQCGTWQRSTKEFTDAIDYVRSGKLGKVVLCRAWITDTQRLGRQKASDPPKELDYNMWTGPAALMPYQPNRVHFNWRWILNTGGGMSTDWGVHMMDIALLGMSKDEDLLMPASVSSYGGLWAIEDDDRDAPDTMEAVYRFKDPDWVLHWSICRDHPGKEGHGTEFVSADGRTLRVWRGGWVVLDPSGKELPKEEAEAPPDHWRNFVDSVKTRAKPRADLRSVAQTTVVCHLSNVALESGETLHWDAKRHDLAGHPGKETMSYRRHYRSGYELPDYRSALA